jgi:hypothetical protein
VKEGDSTNQEMFKQQRTLEVKQMAEIVWRINFLQPVILPKDRENFIKILHPHLFVLLFEPFSKEKLKEF